jgi:hypothetical protein
MDISRQPKLLFLIEASEDMSLLADSVHQLGLLIASGTNRVENTFPNSPVRACVAIAAIIYQRPLFQWHYLATLMFSCLVAYRRV